MFGTLRKHSTWLWAIIIVVVIISFVYFFSPDAKYHFLGKRSGTGVYINDQPVSMTDFENALNEARLYYFLRYHNFPERDEEMGKQNFDRDEQMNNRLLLIEQLRLMNIEPGIDSTVQFRDEMLTGGRAGVNMEAVLKNFEQDTLRKGGLSLADFERFVRHQLGIMHLAGVAGVAGQLITPQEGEQIYRRNHEEVVAELVYFSASNYLASVTNFTTDNLLQVYSNKLAEYTIPERVQVAYVLFNKTNFYEQADATLAKITNLTQQINEYYRQQGTNFFKDKDDQPLAEEAAKAKIKNNMRDLEALRAANKKAYECVNLAFTKETNTLADLQALAATNQMTVQIMEPFDREDGPKGLKMNEKFAELAFKLPEDNPVCLTPMAGEEGIYVFALKQRLPRQVPAFESPGVREKVVKDYQASEAQEMARLAGTIFHISLTNGLAQKRPFTEICLDSKCQPIILPPFSLATTTLSNLPPAVNLNTLKRLAFNLAVGTATDYVKVGDGDGGIILYLRSRYPVDETQLKKELPQFLANLRAQRQDEAFNEWISRQVHAIKHNLPKPKSERGPRGGPQ